MSLSGAKRPAEEDIDRYANKKRKELVQLIAAEEYIKYEEARLRECYEKDLKQLDKKKKENNYDIWEKVCSLSEDIVCIAAEAHDGKSTVLDYVKIPKDDSTLGLLRSNISDKRFKVERLWSVQDAWMDLATRDKLIIDEHGVVHDDREFVLTVDQFMAKYAPAQ
jgi:hypothetical protein